MGTQSYRYLGPYAAVGMGGTMSFEGREVTIPEAVVAQGDVVDLDDEYATWCGTATGNLFRLASDPMFTPPPADQAEPATAANPQASSGEYGHPEVGDAAAAEQPAEATVSSADPSVASAGTGGTGDQAQTYPTTQSA